MRLFEGRTAVTGGTLTIVNWRSTIVGNTMTGSFSSVTATRSNTAPGTAAVTSSFERIPRVG